MNGHTLAPGVMSHAGTPALLGRLLEALPSAAMKGLAIIAVDVPLGFIVLLGALAFLGVLGSIRTPAKED